MSVPDEVREEVEALFHSKIDMHGEPVLQSQMDPRWLVYWHKGERPPRIAPLSQRKAHSFGTENYRGVYFLPTKAPEPMSLEDTRAKLDEVQEHLDKVTRALKELVEAAAEADEHRTAEAYYHARELVKEEQ